MAAGLATRLRPMTEVYPKCLLTIAGAPMLQHWIGAIARSRMFDQTFVNVHHCPETVLAWLEKHEKITGHKATVIDERTGLLGTAGTLFWHSDTEDDAFVAYADTYSREFFEALERIAMLWHWDENRPDVGLVTFNLPEDQSAGAIETDGHGRVTAFREKSGEGLVAWAGMAFIRKEVLKELKESDRDLARDVFPRLCGRMRVIAHVEAFDIGKGVDIYDDLKRKHHKTR